VTAVVTHGAFVDVEGGIVGRIAREEGNVSVGDQVEVVIRSVVPRFKVELSLVTDRGSS
jgi:sulfur carrier protein ThiS